MPQFSHPSVPCHLTATDLPSSCPSYTRIQDSHTIPKLSFLSIQDPKRRSVVFLLSSCRVICMTSFSGLFVLFAGFQTSFYPFLSFYARECGRDLEGTWLFEVGSLSLRSVAWGASLDVGGVGGVVAVSTLLLTTFTPRTVTRRRARPARRATHPTFSGRLLP